MERKIITTLDGSTTIQMVDWDECYHSKNGAIQEAYHVFIKNGLDLMPEKPVSILEIGFGTGLNALITYLESQKRKLNVNYVGVEAYPVSLQEATAMNYCEQLEIDNFFFKRMHESSWDEINDFDGNFKLIKRKQFFHEITDVDQFDLIYFDAFGYQYQPELWSTDIFKKMYTALKDNGVLVTYAARGVVKRSMNEVGFTVKKVEGPPGKREMMIGFKNL
ncbi:MAG: tRNA (5-methylaminomethyl-2-thiouridine)(34)-methyltransferase MnmD [Bacteroidota bacterium]